LYNKDYGYKPKKQESRGRKMKLNDIRKGLLDKNQGAKMRYDEGTKTYIITYSKKEGFQYFGYCELRGDTIYWKGKVVVKLEAI
jgi:hypothetical protein